VYFTFWIEILDPGSTRKVVLFPFFLEPAAWFKLITSHALRHHVGLPFYAVGYIVNAMDSFLAFRGAIENC
jgi:hypothetical protein